MASNAEKMALEILEGPSAYKTSDGKTATERLTHVLDTIEPGETVDMVIDMTDSKTANGIVLCKNCKYADTDGAGHFMCTDYSPPEAEGEAWTTAEVHVFQSGKASDVCASFLFDMKPKTNKPTASGMRLWALDGVRIECPYCHERGEIDGDSLDFDELWHGVPFVFECEECQHQFYVEVGDDDRYLD